MSLNADIDGLKSHWAAYEEGATEAGRIPNRADWRVTKEVLVEETDSEAIRLATHGGLGRFAAEYLAPISKQWLGDKAPPESELDPEFLARNRWIVGSAETVREKLEEYLAETGGFGTLLLLGCDYAEEPHVWRDSLQALSTDVLPKLPNQWLSCPEPLSMANTLTQPPDNRGRDL